MVPDREDGRGRRVRIIDLGRVAHGESVAKFGQDLAAIQVAFGARAFETAFSRPHSARLRLKGGNRSSLVGQER